MSEIWQGCYDSGWQGDITPEAFSHPAKFSRGLIHHIYKHAKEMGWVKSGDWVLDPFGGVALGGLDAMSMGLNWIGIELEEKFVKLGEQNIELWKRNLADWPNLGTARIVQGDSRYGDSRNLRNIVFKGDLIISSPPFVEAQSGGGIAKALTGESDYPLSRQGGKYQGYRKDQQCHTPGNLANMKEGDIDLVVSSPPYADSVNSGPSGIDHSKSKGGRNRAEEVKRTGCVSCQAIGEQRYGTSPGQLGSMPEGSIDLITSSPPYEESQGVNPSSGIKAEKPRKLWDDYSVGKSDGQLGNSSGDTFWSASKEIVSQCYDLLKPDGMSIWVCKDYVKAKKRVPFSDRWLSLCESVGFKLVCRHQAMLVKEYGIQTTIHGDKRITTERKSFFRRLAESKGSPRIDWEDILCLIK